ncbi:alkyl sulfatase dimerization domain-containing protein [Pseudonocardia nigra]|uniref:alkyl sulfatase dimerization domain-containing protein n=1 Tax=Pseudonocardia nigra TaxID=1921578 RepID=UPI001C5F4736|nr:alkyl sulfatase dimerization domain-containing protein [Pseudonocardia nigra]
MTRSLLDLADDVWTGKAPLNEIRRYGPGHLEEVAGGVAMIPGFGHAFAIAAHESLVLFDTGSRSGAEALFRAIRSWDTSPVSHAIYSHGHLDHVGGVGPFDAEADRAGRPRPLVIAHERVLPRFDRYERTRGYNRLINQRQFRNGAIAWPESYRRPDVTYTDTHLLETGGMRLHLRHELGETDDHTVGFLSESRILFPGDLFIWVSPNAGNPQKVQRYPVEWAAALRRMAELDAELMLGSHGVPIRGADRVREALTCTAAYLETIVDQTLAIMNGGGTVLDAVHEVRVPDELAAKPYLQPVYDEPQFVVRNVWRMYGGWYDGNPANLKPAPQGALATEIAALCGGPGRLAERAAALAEEGDLRLAAHLSQLAVQAAPADGGVHAVRARVFSDLVARERSTMARGIYGWAVAESTGVVEGRPTLEQVETLAGGAPRVSL